MSFRDNLKDIIKEREQEDNEKKKKEQLMREYYFRSMENEEIDRLASIEVERIKNALADRVRNGLIMGRGGFFDGYFYQQLEEWSLEEMPDSRRKEINLNKPISAEIRHSTSDYGNSDLTKSTERDRANCHVTVICVNIDNSVRVFKRVVQMLREEGLKPRTSITNNHSIYYKKAKIEIVVFCDKNGKLK